MINPYSEEERLQAMISACYTASRSHFNHLPLRHIINPPVDMFDAKLARQMAIYVLHIDFDVPRRRLVSVLGVARWTVMQAVRTVEQRRFEALFDRAYERISARAKDNFTTALHQAVGQDASYG
ncbi:MULTISPECIES: hypothetical protein [unclassified Rhizobium]|uniref:hypothetical protein n=1 Tax=unclassified Rhizobium TaxID=2613769 RepID=UPI001783EBED|nr:MULTISPECIES: hypothetical protein [unclassified Rhizobium]MBD8686604.1 hypothetical protein [Rhizobium sp. CFBP 13644]MBD8691594.1 hypothetical protein [Rhizobium sp. CFBP 13717]